MVTSRWANWWRCAARATLAGDGRSLSRDNPADALREGHGVSNARASHLLADEVFGTRRVLKAEQGVPIIGSVSSQPRPEVMESLLEAVAWPPAGTRRQRGALPLRGRPSVSGL
jgi:hypothetical protein